MKKDFSEVAYDNYYALILNNLCEMETCEDFGPVLQAIRDDIFNSGWYDAPLQISLLLILLVSAHF